MNTPTMSINPRSHGSGLGFLHKYRLEKGSTNSGGAFLCSLNPPAVKIPPEIHTLHAAVKHFHHVLFISMSDEREILQRIY